MDGPAQASYASNGLLALLGLLTLQQWAILVGIVLSVVTFFVNWHYRKRMVESTEDHQRRMRKITRGEE